MSDDIEAAAERRRRARSGESLDAVYGHEPERIDLGDGKHVTVPSEESVWASLNDEERLADWAADRLAADRAERESVAALLRAIVGLDADAEPTTEVERYVCSGVDNATRYVRERIALDRAERAERSKPICFSAIEQRGGRPGPNGNVFWFDRMIGRIEFDGQDCLYVVATYSVKKLMSIGELDDLLAALSDETEGDE